MASFCRFHVKHWIILLVLLPQIALAQTIGSVTIEDKPIPVPLNRHPQIEQWSRQQRVGDLLSRREQEHFYWLNYSRAYPKAFWDSAVVPILNAFPQLRGAESKSLQKDMVAAEALPLLALSKPLLKTAQLQALDLAERGKVSHDNAKGVGFAARVREAGIRICASENIAIAPDHMLFALVLLYLDIGVPGLGHRKALLDGRLGITGVGVATRDNKQYFIVQDFACPQPN